MRTACLSIEAMYNKLGESLTYGKILVDKTDDNNYYDLLVTDDIACMDGEECEICHDDGHIITLTANLKSCMENLKMKENYYET